LTHPTKTAKDLARRLTMKIIDYSKVKTEDLERVSAELLKIRTKITDKCPELRATLVGDETYYFCTLNERICIREYGYECEEYNEWLRSEEHVEA